MHASVAILWDMDGVLVDTGEFHYQTWQEVLRQQGIPFNRPLFQHTFGMNNAGMLAYLLGRPVEPEFVERIGGEKERLFRQAIHGQVQALPGAAAWVDYFTRQGTPQAVASSAPQENIDLLVDELGLRDQFSFLVSAAGLPGKPDPAVFLKAAQLLHAAPGACVVIEDSHNGLQAARRAGMKSIAVATTHPADTLGEADLVIDSLEQSSPTCVYTL